MLNPGVTEVVELDGDGTDLSEEELERFIATFPIHSTNHGSRMRKQGPRFLL
jgi:hypothetical protein